MLGPFKSPCSDPATSNPAAPRSSSLEGRITLGEWLDVRISQQHINLYCGEPDRCPSGENAARGKKKKVKRNKENATSADVNTVHVD